MYAKNKYVSFVSDEDFLNATEHVCSVYEGLKTDLDMGSMQSQIIDPFKMVFDIYSQKINLDDWIYSEKNRQDDKTVNNAIGEFHQILLGKVPGWIDLGIGDPNHVDLKNNEGKIFIELKNKHNTINDSSGAKIRDKLIEIVENIPDSIAYFAYIVTDKPSGEDIWVYKKETYGIDERIREIRGTYVYELITGNPNALHEVYSALPKAINDIYAQNFSFSDEKNSILKKFYEYAYESRKNRQKFIEYGVLDINSSQKRLF